jgi:hypothetical protein
MALSHTTIKNPSSDPPKPQKLEKERRKKKNQRNPSSDLFRKRKSDAALALLSLLPDVISRDARN